MRGQNSLRLIRDGVHDGRWNMARDEFLFRDSIQTQDQNAVLRFYRFSEPTLTVGYGLWKKIHQNLSENIPAVRRITGGGIVSHETSDLTYAFIAPYRSFLSLRKTRGSYLFIHEALKKALVDFGIETRYYEGCTDQCTNLRTDYCFESPVLYDVMLGSKKIAGAGQKRTLGYLLHQGSIAWDLLAHVQPKFSEVHFCIAFSNHLAKSLNLAVKEIPFLAEEISQAIVDV